MKPPIIYTLLGCTITVAPGGRTASASKPGGENMNFASLPNGASAQVQAQWWVHGKKLPEAAPDPRRGEQTPRKNDTRPPNLSAGPQSIEESLPAIETKAKK